MSNNLLIKGDGVLISQPRLIEDFGEATARFINQIHYWIEKKQGVVVNDARWIYNTAIEWARQVKVSSRHIERIIKKLREQDIIIVEHFDRTSRINYITINYKKVNAIYNKTTNENVTKQREKKDKKMSDSRRCNVGIYYIDTKTTQKENKSSEKKQNEIPANERVQIPLEAMNQNVGKKIKNKQVDKIDNVEKKYSCLKKGNKYLNNKNVEKKEKINHFNQEEKQEQTNQHKKTKNNTVQDMIAIWNRMFENKKTPLNKDLCKNLVAAFNIKFKKNKDLFENYLEKIKSSAYLTGTNFNLSIHWVLSFKTIDRIFNGEFGVKDIPLKQKAEDVQKMAQDHIDGVNESEPCRQLRYKLLRVLGAFTYTSWFTKIHLTHDEKGFHFKAETPFFQEYITNHFFHLFC